TIRAAAEGHLDISCSAKLSTAEAIRAITHAALLLEAGAGLNDVLCDVTNVRRGPGNLLLVAAAIAFRQSPDFRVAFVANPRQVRAVRRLIRFSGLQNGMVVLTSRADAESWLEAGALVTVRNLGITELKHAEHLLGIA